MKNKKQRRVMFLLILILGLTIGFALLSTTLKINGTAGIKSNTWNIHWNKNSINVLEGSVEAETPVVSKATSNDDTVSFNVELDLPGDFYEFEIDAINEGSIDGALDLAENWITYKIEDSEATLPSYMDFKVTYDDNTTPTSGDVLKATESKTYKVRVEYKSGVEELPENPKPVTIEVNIPYIQHKEAGIQYNLGDLVYFDPVSDAKCDSTTFSLENINSGNSTCYKWRVITTNDTTSKTNIKLQLDHNLLGRNVPWTKTTDVATHNGETRYTLYNEDYEQAGPGGALSMLSQYTSNWTRVPLLNYTYDTSAGRCYTTPAEDDALCNYGVLTCTNGTCKIAKGSEEKELATNLRVRMITIEEITEAVNTIADADAVSQTFTLATSMYDDSRYYFTSNYYKIGYTGTSNGDGIGNNTLGWIIENTERDNPPLGATANIYRSENHGEVISGIQGYWTMSPTSGCNNCVWTIKSNGYLDIGGGFIQHSAHALGARPVINIEKSKITKN